MGTIAEALKNASNGGVLPLEVAMKIAGAFDLERDRSRSILKRCERDVGMVLGEDINQHLAEMSGLKFNPVDYHYERPVGDQ